ncbi:MAG TPA: hypothetical protein VHM30_19080 [Gemmatimonadaceae bacterium]|nr:hypothetical protein [Gemmatimonadaceae bacterium]
MTGALGILHLAATALVVAWSIWITGRIARGRSLPRHFVGITGLGGLMLVPGIIATLATASMIYGRALVGVSWVWPATLTVFAVQAWYATSRGFVVPTLGVPIAVYDTLIAAAGWVQFAVRVGGTPPVPLLALLGAEIGALAIGASPAAFWSPLWFHAPLFAPAFPARYRFSATARVILAALAATWAGLIVARLWPAAGAAASYARYETARMRERPQGDFAIGVKLFPTLHGAIPPVAVREDLALVDTLDLDVVAVTIAPDGVRRSTLDSLARVLEAARSDSTLLVVTLGNATRPLAPGRRARLDEERRLEAVRSIARRLRPDYLLPIAEPYGRAATVYGVLPVTTWARYLARAAAAARQVSPRTRIGYAAARFDAADSALFAWAAAEGSPIDALGFSIFPSDRGARGLDADMYAADRFIRATRSRKEHWVWSAGSFPSAQGEASQDLALSGILAWATSRAPIRGVIVAEAGDYDTTIGLRSANRRLRRATFTVRRSIRALRENR